MNVFEILLSILLKGAPTNDDFVEAIKSVPVLADLSAGILLDRSPTNAQLLSIIAKVPQRRRTAWSKLLEQKPTNDEILWIIEKIDDLRQEAWEQLLRQSPSSSDLIRIVNGVRTLEVLAWQKLTKLSPTEAELLIIYDQHVTINGSVLRVPVASLLTRPESQNGTLMKIIRNEEGLRAMAVKLLLQKMPSRDELRDLLPWTDMCANREEICQFLMEGEPSWQDLHSVAIFSRGFLGNEAAKKMLSQQYESEFDEEIACRAVLNQPTFARRALDRILTIIDRKTNGEGSYPYNLRNLYFDLVNLEAQNDLRLEVARRFLKTAASDRDWSRDVSEILKNHPELRTLNVST